MTDSVPTNSIDTSGTPIRVLIVGPALPLIGGQTVQAMRLLKAFGREPGLAVDFQPINPSFLPRLQKIKFVRTFVTSVKYITDLLRKTREIDVVHVFSASYFSFLLAPLPALLVAKLYKKRTILNYRSGEARDHLTRWSRTAIPTVKSFDRVVTPSGYLVDVFSEFGIKARSITNFVDLQRFRFRERESLRPVFLSNRNFESLYNVSCLLRAFRLIQDEVPTASLILVGDGSEREKLKTLVSELRLENIEFVGSVSPEEMPSYYDRTDIYLNSPSIDNMPNSIIEAFACGLPVVSTNAGGIPYIVEDGKTGLLVDVDDHRSLAAAALKLFSDPTLPSSLVRNAQTEVQKYSWTQVRSDWLRLYEELAGRKISNFDEAAV